MGVAGDMVSLRNGSHQSDERWAKHIGWAFSGLAEFESRATLFLADGFHRGERLMYVADDPPRGPVAQEQRGPG